jgi:hypothetical protein
VGSFALTFLQRKYLPPGFFLLWLTQMMHNPGLAIHSQMEASDVKFSELLLNYFKKLFLPSPSLSATALQTVAKAF